MSFSNTFETQLLNHIFANADIANVGDAAGLQNSVADGNLYIALHTADPGEAGNATTSEATYTGYARKPVSRTNGWTVSGNQVSNAGEILFDECTAGTNTITHASIVKELSGASDIIASFALNASLAVATGVTPKFSAGQITGTID